MVTEDEFIKTFLKPLAKNMKGSLGLDDDAAILPHKPGKDIITSKDILHADQHFYKEDDPANIAHKALATNLSDIAAKGATPLCFMLGIAFPKAPEEKWLKGFIKGLESISDKYNCHLLGGDTTGTKGLLSLSVTIFGEIEAGKMVKRRGAKPGDHLYLSGSVGNAALGFLLKSDQLGIQPTDMGFEPDLKKWSLTSEQRQQLEESYLRPTPRVELAEPLKNYASAAMDVSDGLLADLPKLCAASACGADIELASIPFSEPAKIVFAAQKAEQHKLHNLCLSWGDDYEILSAVPPENAVNYVNEARIQGINVQKIGKITPPGQGIRLLDETGTPCQFNSLNFSHF